MTDLQNCHFYLKLSEVKKLQITLVFKESKTFFRKDLLFHDAKIKEYFELKFKVDVFTRCGHVVRDFESEAKTRCNFQF